jgi:hypothetical protein
MDARRAKNIVDRSAELACDRNIRRDRSLGEHRSWHRNSIQTGVDVCQDPLLQRRITP